jgi:hypothetical protein
MMPPKAKTAITNATNAKIENSLRKKPISDRLLELRRRVRAIRAGRTTPDGLLFEGALRLRLLLLFFISGN